MSKIVSLRGKELVRISVNSIKEPDFPLRTIYNPDTLSELADSLTEGILSPIIVTRYDEKMYEIHVGTRRWKASKLKGYKEIPAFVIGIESPVEMLMLALTENIHREDLDPFEEARAFLRLIRTHGLTSKEIAQQMKKKDHYIISRIQLLSLPEEVQDLIADGKLPISITTSIARLPTGEMQVHYAKKAAVNKLTASELAAIIRNDRKEDVNVSMHNLTSEKAVARIAVFAQWMNRVPDLLSLKHINADERTRLLKSLTDLEETLRATRQIISNSAQGNLSFDEIVKKSELPENHGEEWSIDHINQITAPNRPSDDVLSQKLGRSIGGICAMRSKINSEAKHKKK